MSKRTTSKNRKKKIQFNSQNLIPKEQATPEYWKSLVNEFGREKVMAKEGLTSKQLDTLLGIRVSFKSQLSAAFKAKKES